MRYTHVGAAITLFAATMCIWRSYATPTHWAALTIGLIAYSIHLAVKFSRGRRDMIEKYRLWKEALHTS